MPAHIAQLSAHIAIPPKIGRIYLIKRREVNNAYVTKKSLKGESYIGAMMPTEGSAQGKYRPYPGNTSRTAQHRATKRG
jgi:hypothetical protein